MEWDKDLVEAWMGYTFTLLPEVCVLCSAESAGLDMLLLLIIWFLYYEKDFL